MKLDNFVVYDVEIANSPDKPGYSWESPYELGFASAVAYESATDRYHFFLHDYIELLDLLQGKTAVTFNGIKFDSRVILGNDRSVDMWGQTSKVQTRFFHDNYDLLLEYLKARYGFENVAQAEKELGGPMVVHDGSFGLDGLAEGTLGLRKTGHGAKAPLLYQKEQYAELLAYNLHDVRLTRKLFEFAREYGYLVDREGRVITLNMEK